ncbi:hypothetical protein SSS_02905 [Sarcoptes scabiei]|nr:hypothetical protein SSS_02905 [Sarcoptes scabiei]
MVNTRNSKQSPKMTEPDYSDLANLEFEKIAEFVEKAHFQGNSEAFKMGMACLILKHKESINKSDTQSVKADLKVMQEGLIKMDDKINDISNKLELPPTAEAQTYANVTKSTPKNKPKFHHLHVY